MERQYSIICMPTLSLILLIYFRVKRSADQIVIYYEEFPRYLRYISLLLMLKEDDLQIWINKIIKIKMVKISHGDKITNYPYLHLDSLNITADIAFKLIDIINIQPLMLKLGKLLGNSASLSYALSHIAENNIFHHLLPLRACYHGLDKKGKITLVWNSCWPEDWLKPFREAIPDISFSLFKWPRWYSAIQRLLWNMYALFILPLRISYWIIRRGVVRNIKISHYKIITEFIDPFRLNGTSYDSDYLIKNNQEYALFYLTNKQKRKLLIYGIKLNDIKQLFTLKGYKLAVLDELPYTIRNVFNIFQLYCDTLWLINSCENNIIGKIYHDALFEYLELLPLFEHYRGGNLIYLTYPNGRTGFRENDAIVTGLCRIYGTNSVGCQTRTIYATKYHDSFDCFDLYLKWGSAWHEAFPWKMPFVRESVVVGCIYLDSLLPEVTHNSSPKYQSPRKDTLIVSIFPSDLDNHHHYTISYCLRFLLGCAQLAIKHPKIKFLVKLKDPNSLNLLNKELGFKEAIRRTPHNFHFANEGTYEYTQIMSLSDIVITIGYTTPGAEALLLGKRAIYYSELECGGQAFRHLPDLIASNQEDLEYLFRLALKDYRRYCLENAAGISRLDPYRDGRARERILNLLNS